MPSWYLLGVKYCNEVEIDIFLSFLCYLEYYNPGHGEH